VGTTSSQIRW